MYINYTGNEANGTETGQIVNMYVDIMNSTQVVINTPSNSSTFLAGLNINFNTTSTSPIGLSNITMYINGSLNETKSLSGLTDTGNFTKSFNTQGNYTYYFTACSTDGSCINSLTQLVIIKNIIINSVSYSSTIFETANETFIVNLSANSSLTAVNLVYNSTSYSMTNLTNGNWSVTIDIPTGAGVNSFYFNYTYAGTNTISSSYNQNVNLSIFGICNDSYTTRYYSLNFKDESNSSVLSAKNDLTDITYYIGGGDTYKAYLYSNSTANQSYFFCFSPPSSSVNVAMTFKYSNTNYPLRTFYLDTTSLTNSSTSQTLYMLSSSEGIYSAVQVLNTVNYPISGATVLVEREISGVWTTIGRETTGSDGLATFWVNPNFEHRISVEASGYTSFQGNVIPSQSSYTVQLTSLSASNYSEYYRGIVNKITPTVDYLDQSEIYNFSYSLTSTYWNVTGFGFLLYYGNNNSLINISNSSSNGGTITFYNVNVTSEIYARYYYIVNGTTVYSGPARGWINQSTYGRQYSISRFLSDFGSYSDAGLLGMDNFGKALISLVFIVLATGTLSYRYGLRSDILLIGVIFGLVFFLDVGIGFIPRVSFGGDNIAIPGFPTFIAAGFLAYIIFREETQ